ncbi:MAG TPA: tryptophan synthase subunit alpha, partial [Acidobacteriota bacterium]|nr:tryptophan synthase subunit alpha [Acidobacteriota bacterium]
PQQIRSKAMQIKQYTRVPVALGFGIKSVEDTLPYREVIDAFIVGSKIIEYISAHRVEDLRQFYESFRSGS